MRESRELLACVPGHDSQVERCPIDKRQGHGRQGNSNVVWVPRRHARREESNKAGEQGCDQYSLIAAPFTIPILL